MMLITWVPGSAPSMSDGSASDGIVASSIGASGRRPNFAASWARSIASIPVAMTIRPRRTRASSPAAVNRGRPESTRLTLATVPGVRILPARHSSDGPTATGSASWVRARFGIDAGDHRPCAELLAVGKDDAGRAPVTRGDVRHVGAGPDLDAGRGGGCRQRRGQGAWAAADEDRLAGRAAVVAGGVDEQHRGRSRRPRSHRGVLDAAPRERRLQCVGLERFGDEIRDRHRQDARDRPAVVLAEAAERPPEPEAGQGVTETGRFDVRRCLPGDLAEEPGERTDEPIEGGVLLGIGSGPGPQPIGGLGRVAPQDDRVAIRSRREGPDVRADQRQPVTLEVEVADDRRSEAPDRVGEGRHPRPGRELGRADRATDRVTPLQDDRSQARLAEVCRGDEPVVAAPDDDRVVLVDLGVAHDGHA